MIVHFDGKISSDITKRELIDRLAVVVTVYNVDQLLGISKLTTGTGEAVSEAVITTLLDWNIQDRVKAMSFDATAANTGTKAGVCTLVEKKLDRELLHLACRHHMYEVVLSEVFKHSLGQSSGPEIGLFKRFHDKWSLIDKEDYETALNDQTCSDILASHSILKQDALFYLKTILKPS